MFRSGTSSQPMVASLAVAGLCDASSLFRNMRDVKVPAEQLQRRVTANKPL